MVIFCWNELYLMVHIMSWVWRGVDVLLLIKLYLKVYTLWVWLLVFFPSNWQCTHCAMGVAYFHSNKLYLMVKISWHEFNVVWMWLFSQMAVPDGVQVVWIWCGCGFLFVVMLFQAWGGKVLFIVLLHEMQDSSIQQTLRTVQVALWVSHYAAWEIGLHRGKSQYTMHVGRCPQHYIILACSCCKKSRFENVHRNWRVIIAFLWRHHSIVCQSVLYIVRYDYVCVVFDLMKI